MKIHYFKDKKLQIINSIPDDYKELKEDEWLWIDLSNEFEFSLDKLSNQMGFSINKNLQLSEKTPSKFLQENTENLLFIKGLDAKSDDIDFETIRIGFIYTDKVLITFHREQSVSIEKYQSHLNASGIKPNSPLEIVIGICRIVFDRYLPIITKLESEIDEITDKLNDHSDDNLLNDLTFYRLKLKRLKRYAIYHNESFSQMLNENEDALPPEIERKLILIIGTLERLKSLSQLFYEDCRDLIDGYISISSHRLNNIMKVLTIVTVLFVPLSFLAGIYGMNFENIPELKSQYGYFYLLGIMASIFLGAFIWLKRKKWY